MGKDLDIIQAVKEQDISSLQKLLQKAGKLTSKNKIIGNNKKFNVNFQDGDGMSALHQAALMGNTDVIQLLVDSGASTELRDNKGMIPLHYATWQGKSEPVHILLQKGSSVNLHAAHGETPLHLACQHGHMDVTNLLLLHHADPTLTNKDHKTPLDLACEFGRYKVAELLLHNNLCKKLLGINDRDLVDNNHTTCMHLAARNGHADIITLLLQVGMDINRATLNGTCLHEASLYGKIEVVKLLLDCGIDVNKPNSYDQTALDIVNKFTSTRAAKELKQILKEASLACQARAVRDYCSVYDPSCLSFKEGDIITVLEQKTDGIWKGYVVQGSGRMAKTGYFPANHVVLVDSQAIAKQEAGQSRHVAAVPDLLSRSPGYLGGISSEDVFPPPPSPLAMARPPNRAGIVENNHHGQPPPPYSAHNHQYHGGGKTHVSQSGADHADWPPTYSSLHTGGDMRASSPAKDASAHSPANSNRNSAASSDSGRGISTGHLEPKIHNLVTVQVSSQHRLSGQSYESGVSSRQSYHSTSSSSLGSLDRLEESGYASTINVSELVHAGVPDQEVLHAWLADLKYDDYFNNFSNAGYDMPTISRMTPEDLTAIGITKPAHRKRLKAEIARLNIHDGIPDFKPLDMLEWLHLLGLGQYYETLTTQGYDNIDFVTDITWEDLEEIGIQKLGHQKKIMLAIDRLKRIMAGAKRLSSMEKRRASQELLEPPPPAGSVRWSGDMAPQHVQELGVGAKPKKSPSGDSIATVSSGGSGGSGGSSGSGGSTTSAGSLGSGSSGEMRITHLREGGHSSSGPDVVAIQVKRSSSRTPSTNSETTTPEGKDMAGQPISYKSFQAPGGDRRSGNSLDKDVAGGVVLCEQQRDADTVVMVAPVVPKLQTKPKPVATIIAKTRRSSREYSPDNVEIEKHESECNSDGNKNIALAGGMVHSGTLKKNQGRGMQQEHIYDMPHVGPQPSPLVPPQQGGPPPKAPKPKPSLVISQLPISESGSPGPASPLFINTQNQEAAPSTPSPTGKGKRAPPPPPKRTHSIRNEGPTQMLREEVQDHVVHPTFQRPVNDIQEAPRPKPSPVPPKPSAKPQQQVQGQPHVTAHSQQEIPKQQQAFASCVQSLSQRFGSKREETAAQENTSSDGEEFPPPPPPIAMDIITPKIHNYGIPSKSDKAAAAEYGGLQSKMRRDLGTGSAPQERRGFSDRGEGRTFGANLRRHMSPPKETPKGSVHGIVKSSDDDSSRGLIDKRSDSTTSFESTSSSSSVDSNTLPFANENVGTIKQRTPAAKPSIVECSDGVNGQRTVDLNASIFEENSGTIKRTFGHSPLGKNSLISHANPVMSGSRPVVTVSGMSAPMPHSGVVRPPVPSKPSRDMTTQPHSHGPSRDMTTQPHPHPHGPSRDMTTQPHPRMASQDGSSLRTKPARQTESGDVLFDIDNMLQGLTEELDAMLEEEAGC